MKQFGAGRLLQLLVICVCAWAVVAAGSLFVGSTGSIAWPDAQTLRFRLEPVLLASLVGAALAAAGVTYQSLLGNPLADPFLLGTSSGAMLASYAWTLPAFSFIAAAFPMGQQAAAFAGAMLAVAIVLAIAGRRGRLEPTTMILAGVIVNAVCAAVFLLCNAIVKDRATRGGIEDYLIGGLPSILTPAQLWTARIVIAAGFASLLAIAGQLNAGGMQDSEAQAAGVSINRLRWVGIVVASLITASAVAVSGPIGFVGLICPHLARLFTGSDVRRLLPVATMLGAIMLCVADASARKISSFGPVGTYLPVGVITSLLGGPFFLMLLLSRRK